MFTINISSACNFNLLLHSNSNITWGDTENLLLNAYVPSALITATSVGNIIINHIESSDYNFVIQNNTITIYDTRNTVFPLYMYHLIYSIFRDHIISNDIYSCHSICVSKNNKNILLVGHSGTGKSNIALTLAEKEGFSIITGNKTLLSLQDNVIYCVGGTTTLTLVETDKENYVIQPKSITQYYNRIAFKNPYINKTKLPLQIHSIVILKGFGSNSNELLSHNSAIHTLYPYLMDYYYKDTILENLGSIYIGKNPSQNSTEKIKHIISHLNSVKIYNIRGSIDHITSYITNICQ